MIISEEGEVLSFSWPQIRTIVFKSMGCDNFCNAAAGDQARDLPDADEG